MAELIRIKPHHFIDIITAFGAGQTQFEPHPYGHAVHTVAARIAEEPDVLLEMEFGADDICEPCVHNIDGVCDDTIDTSYRPAAPASKREWNLLLDTRWAARLGIEQGGQLTAREFCARLRGAMAGIMDVYREMPAGRTAARAANLEKGIETVLEAGAQSDAP